MPRDMLYRYNWELGESVTTTHTPAGPIRQKADDESPEWESIGDATRAATDDEVARA
jgi:hypothetical protein